MIRISFIVNGHFDVSQIPALWQKYVCVTRIPIVDTTPFPNDTHTQSTAPHRYNSLVSIEVQPDDSSYRYRALMQPGQLVLKFWLPFYFEFPVGASVKYEGQSFYFKRPQDLKKQGERNIEYSITMYADDANLCNYKIRNTVDGRLKWSMCARPHEFIEEIVKNLNMREGANKWKVGTCIESTEKTVEFNHTNLDAALSDVASAFETEYEITPDFVINLRKVEYNKTDMLPLSYGRGNGFVPGVGRTSEQGGEPVKRMYAQGGERNINRETYGEMFDLDDKPGELLLPLSQSIRFDGEHFEGDEGFNAETARTYKSDEHGYYIERVDEISDATKEDSIDCSEIYPSRVGKCSDVTTIDAAKNLYDFVDDSIPPNLDFNSYLIAGETMTVIFQTGMLAGDGKEFEVKYFHDSVNGKAARRFEIVPQEIDGITMPNETFKPKFGENGDKYAVFGIQLPKEYICNDDDKSGASWDMMRETVRKLYECEEQKFTFTGELQSMWAKRNWEHVGGKIVVGGYVLFTDNQFAPNGSPIRIVGIKDYITNPYAPTIELSNSITTPGSVASSLRQIDNTEVVIGDTKRDVMRFTKRRFRDALETIGMLEDAQLNNFNSAISPVAIQTMAMLVGDESLQFLMGKTIATIGSDDWSIGFKDNALTADAGFLRHMTIGVNSITANRENTDYLTWQMPAMNLAPKSGVKYYVYAVVNRSGFAFNEAIGANICNTPGEWLIDDKSHRIDENPGKYHLLVGVLNSEYNGERSFATLYGFTEILPGRMTTDIIISNDGKTYMNLQTGEICGNIKFLSDDPENPYITIIKGGKIKSELIDVSKLIARAVIVGDEEKQRVEICPDERGNGSVRIFDEAGNEVAVFEGMKYDGTDMFDNTSGQIACLETHSFKKGTGDADFEISDAELIELTDSPIHSESNIEFIFNANLKLRCLAGKDWTQLNGNVKLGSASANLYLVVNTYEDCNCTKLLGSTSTLLGSLSVKNMSTSGQEDQIKTIVLNDKSARCASGYHRVYIQFNYRVCNRNAMSEALLTSTALRYAGDFYVSRYFANGFCLGSRGDNYVMAQHTATGMMFAIESGEHGLRVTPAGGVELKNADGSWAKLS